eukprot:scaffold300482_cov39-Tisochrysis_lutea.AAC.1
MRSQPDCSMEEEVYSRGMNQSGCRPSYAMFLWRHGSATFANSVSHQLSDHSEAHPNERQEFIEAVRRIC